MPTDVSRPTLTGGEVLKLTLGKQDVREFCLFIRAKLGALVMAVKHIWNFSTSRANIGLVQKVPHDASF
jgi:hypothetical protein